MPDAYSRQGVSRGETYALAGLAILAAILLWPKRQGQNIPADQQVTLPTLMAEGWLNSNSPISKEELAGKVVVIDFWATWCPPCRVAMPGMAKLYAQYKPLGVEFIGLTPEAESQRQAIEEYMATVDGFDWPVGYGAGPTFAMMEVEVLPTVYVFGPQGNSIWVGSHLRDLPDVLDATLAKMLPD